MDIVRDDSLRSYVTNPVMNFTTMGLIILGGLGFVVWKDLWQGFKKIVKDKVPVKRMIQQWRFQTKIVLSITSFLILFGTILIFLFEYHNPATMESLSLTQKIQASLFQSVTTRTAGFETVAQAAIDGCNLRCFYVSDDHRRITNWYCRRCQDSDIRNSCILCALCGKTRRINYAI